MDTVDNGAMSAEDYVDSLIDFNIDEPVKGELRKFASAQPPGPQAQHIHGQQPQADSHEVLQQLVSHNPLRKAVPINTTTPGTPPDTPPMNAGPTSPTFATALTSPSAVMTQVGDQCTKNNLQLEEGLMPWPAMRYASNLMQDGPLDLRPQCGPDMDWALAGQRGGPRAEYMELQNSAQMGHNLHSFSPRLMNGLNHQVHQSMMQTTNNQMHLNQQLPHHLPPNRHGAGHHQPPPQINYPPPTSGHHHMHNDHQMHHSTGGGGKSMNHSPASDHVTGLNDEQLIHLSVRELNKKVIKPFACQQLSV